MPGNKENYTRLIGFSGNRGCGRIPSGYGEPVPQVRMSTIGLPGACTASADEYHRVIWSLYRECG
jgi:hypothetical protein